MQREGEGGEGGGRERREGREGEVGGDYIARRKVARLQAHMIGRCSRLERSFQLVTGNTSCTEYNVAFTGGC